MSQTTPLPPPDEVRRLMHLDWAEAAARDRPPLPDRTAAIRDIIANPFHDAAFGELSLPDIMLISIHHLMERHQWSQVWRAAAKLHRMQREDELRRVTPSHEPEPAEAPNPNPVTGAAARAETVPLVQPASSDEPAPPEPPASPARSRAAHPATTRDLLAPSARRSLPIADFEPMADQEPPFT